MDVKKILAPTDFSEHGNKAVDTAIDLAKLFGASVEIVHAYLLQPPMAKPHGLRETCLLSPAGYAWVASRPLSMAERAARG